MICNINLSTGKVDKDQIPQDITLKYLNGRGINSYLLYKHSPHIDTCEDPNNPIIISAGLFPNTSAPSSGRTCISVRRSAEGYSFTDGNLGGRFATVMRAAGFDTLRIVGIAPELCYILLQDGEASIKFDPLLRLANTYKTQEYLKGKHPGCRSIVVGPAAENHNPIATIMSDDRAAGGASGYVFGIKKLKAVVAVGEKRILAKNQDDFLKVCQEAEQHVKSHPLFEQFSKYGTSLLVNIHNEKENFPTYNWELGSSEFARGEVNHEQVYKRALPEAKKRELFESEDFGCYNCVLQGCSHVYEINGQRVHKLEYEALNCFSAKIGGVDLELVLELNRWCNAVGVDLIRATGLYSGSYVTVSPRFSEEIEKEFKNFIINVTMPTYWLMRQNDNFIQMKGKALSSFDPRVNFGAALAAATSTRGADHLRSLPTWESYAHWYKDSDLSKYFGIPPSILQKWVEEKALEAGPKGKEYLVKFAQENHAVADSVGLCKFLSSWRFGLGFEWIARFLTPLLGIKFEWEDVQKVGERVTAVERLMIEQDHSHFIDDSLHGKFYKDVNGEGIDRSQFNNLLQRYYKLCGYNTNGYVRISTAQRLEIEL